MIRKKTEPEINVIEIDSRDATYQTGIERYINILSAGMPKNVKTYRIFLYRYKKNEVRITETDTELSVHCPAGMPVTAIAPIIMQMWGFKISKMQNLIVKNNCMGTEAIAYAIRSGFYCKLISVLHFSHQWILDGRPDRKNNPYYGMDCIISVFGRGVEYLNDIGNKRPVHVILNGIEKPKIAPRKKDGVFRFIFAHGWSPRKGLMKILPAIKKVAEKHPNIEVLILGGYEPEVNVEKLTEGLPVKVLGLITDEAEINKYYDMSDCALFASASEACSIAGIEAMVRNMPIISTDAEGLAEMFANAARYVKMDPQYNIDPDEYAQAMCDIIENSRLRNKLSVLAYSRYVSHYNAKKMCSQTLDLYKKLLDLK